MTVAFLKFFCHPGSSWLRIFEGTEALACGLQRYIGQIKIWVDFPLIGGKKETSVIFAAQFGQPPSLSLSCPICRARAVTPDLCPAHKATVALTLKVWELSGSITRVAYGMESVSGKSDFSKCGLLKK